MQLTHTYQIEIANIRDFVKDAFSNVTSRCGVLSSDSNLILRVTGKDLSTVIDFFKPYDVVTATICRDDTCNISDGVIEVKDYREHKMEVSFRTNKSSRLLL